MYKTSSDTPDISHPGPNVAEVRLFLRRLTMTTSEEYEELAARLTADDYDIKGTGRVLRGEEAAAYGRAVLEEAVGGPEKFAEFLKEYGL
jgi:hypothetical protein